MGKKTTAIVIFVLVLLSVFSIILIAAGIEYAYFSPYTEVNLGYSFNGSPHDTIETYTGHVSEGIFVVGVGAAILSPSVSFLAVYIHSTIKDSKNASKMKTKLNAKFGPHASEVEFILEQYKKKMYGNPYDVMETRLKAKIALGKTEKEAIQELYEEAKN